MSDELTPWGGAVQPSDDTHATTQPTQPQWSDFPDPMASPAATPDASPPQWSEFPDPMAAPSAAPEPGQPQWNAFPDPAPQSAPADPAPLGQYQPAPSSHAGPTPTPTQPIYQPLTDPGTPSPSSFDAAAPQSQTPAPGLAPYTGPSGTGGLPSYGASLPAGGPLPSWETAAPARPEPPVLPTSDGISRVAWVAAVLGAVVLLAGGGFFAFSALGASGGAESPEEAMDTLIEAWNNEDFVAVAEMLEPGERRAIAEPLLFDVLPELQRIGVFADSVGADGTDGLDFELVDVTYDVELPIDSPDVALIRFTGGTSNQNVDFTRIYSQAMQDEMVDSGEELSASETTELAGSDPFVLVERDGRWYLSLVYSVMESALPGELPALGSGLEPVGAESPEAAVEAMLTNLVDLRIRPVIAGFEPGEMHALHRYSPLFIDDVEQFMADLDQSLTDEGVAMELTGLDFDTREQDGDTIVELRGFVFTGTSPDGTVTVDYARDAIAVDANFGAENAFSIDVTSTSIVMAGTVDGSSGELRVAINDDRTEWRIDGSFDGETGEATITSNDEGTEWSVDADVAGETLSGTITIDDQCSPYRFESSDGIEEGCLNDDLGGDVRAQLDVYRSNIEFEEFPGVPFVVAENEGEWFVSPIGTMMHGVVSGLEQIDDGAFDQWTDAFGSNEVLDELADLGALQSESDPVGAVDEAEAIAALEAAEAAAAEAQAAADAAESASGSQDGAEDAATGELEDGQSNVYDIDVPLGSVSNQSGTVATNGLDRWYFDLPPGAAVAVRVDSAADGGMDDPKIAIFDAADDFVGVNDDFDGLNSGIRFEAPDGGEFSVVVEEVFGRGGAYDLTIEVAESLDSLTVAAGADVAGSFVDAGGEAVVQDARVLDLTTGPVEFVDSLALSTYDTYQLTTSGGTIVIELVPADGSSLDPALFLVDEAGNVIDENDDADSSFGLPGLSSRIETTLAAGTYTIEARSFGDLFEGAYEIRVSQQ